MAEPQTWRERADELANVIHEVATGGTSVNYQGRQLTMASLSQLWETLERYEARAAYEELPAAAKKARRSRVYYVTLPE